MHSYFCSGRYSCFVRRAGSATALRQADQARTDFAAIESELEVIQVQLARLPTHRGLTKTALGIIFTTMSLLYFLR
jgi:hypothetical protein